MKFLFNLLLLIVFSVICEVGASKPNEVVAGFNQVRKKKNGSSSGEIEPKVFFAGAGGSAFLLALGAMAQSPTTKMFAIAAFGAFIILSIVKFSLVIH